MILDRRPFATGHAVTYGLGRGPDRAFDRQEISAGWAFWYAPFSTNAVLLGAAWEAQVSLGGGEGRALQLLTPSIRLAFEIL